MYRQSPSRNLRSKRTKVKHALQICLLVAVCLWLIYQVKHYHDRKKEFDENDAKASLHGGSSGGFINLGRKDIHPRDEESVNKNGRHDEAAEEEETTEEEVEENKHEEDRPEDEKVEEEETTEEEVEENKHEEDRPEDEKVEEEDEGLRDGDDEIDEHQLEKLDTEGDREEDSVNDVEREDGVENETEGKIMDDVNGRIEKESSVEDAGHDGDDKSNHEALEEVYKADDASSAVTHDNHTEATENDNEGVRISNEHPQNILEQENEEKNIEETNNGEIRQQLEVEGGEIVKDDNPSNVTDSETNVTTRETKENTLDSSEEGSSPNNTLTELSDDNLETSNSTTEVSTQNPELSLQNVTEGVPELDHGQGIVTEGTSTEGSNLQTIALEQGNNSTLDVENNLLDSNSTGHAESKNAVSNFEEFSNPSNNTDSSALIKISRSEDPLEAGTNTESAKSDISDGTDEVLESAITENPEEVQIDAVDLSDSSNSSEEKDIRIHLDTLPEIQTEGTNSEDAAAE